MRLDGEGKERPIGPAAEKVDGIVFGFMEEASERPKKDRFHEVAVEDIVLDNPLLLIPDRHTDGKSFGPSASQCGDDSAKALLDDIIRDNPAQVAALGEVRQRYFKPA